MAKKMPRRLVALSASAVATIYVAGLLSTQPVASDPQVAPASTVAVAAAQATSTPAVVVGASAATSTPTAVASPTSAAQPTAAASTYANGTYSATGASRLGNVTVSLTIASDSITNVQITSATTKFPVSRIASLPAQVISAQSANVNVVTGATYSSQAFKQAVQQALAKAHAAAA